MRRRPLLLAGVLFLALGCSKGPTSPNPTPDPGPKPNPPATGAVVPNALADTAVAVMR